MPGMMMRQKRRQKGRPGMDGQTCVYRRSYGNRRGNVWKLGRNKIHRRDNTTRLADCQRLNWCDSLSCDSQLASFTTATCVGVPVAVDHRVLPGSRPQLRQFFLFIKFPA
eukprot:GHVU01108387.1.p1 GENE.GHVU01108387.1~~GHVU01108387.1.p1  ORF type:complete len:110 (-),score=5.93 GHVU01108387.1:634-963(-)